VYAPAPPPVWSWTGFYVGLQGGAGWGPVEWTQQVNLGLIAPLLPAIFSTGSHTTSGAFGGGVIGLNWQAGWLVFGVEADANWADIDGTSNCGVLALFNCRTKTESFGTVTARVGAAVDKALIYIKAGGAWAHNRYELNLLGVNIGLGGGIAIQPSSIEDTRWGWLIGTGLEYALPGNWSAKVEYNFMDFNSENYLFNTIAGLPAPFTNIADRFEINDRLHVVKFGVNYRFGGWGGAPLYASY
jgi:outer membrane immunogenic protein